MISVVTGCTSHQVVNVNDIKNFVNEICCATQMEYECLICSLIYIRRMIQTSKDMFVLSKHNWKATVLACMVMANKVWDDFHVRNADYCYIFGGLTQGRVDELEIALMIVLSHELYIKPSEYAACHFEIQDMITMLQIEKMKLHGNNSALLAVMPPVRISLSKDRKSVV